MPDYLPGCVQKVKAKNSTLCDWDTVCKVAQEANDIYCKERYNHDGTPFDEPLPQVVNGKICYCCCSCFAQYTPIEVSPGEFVAIRDIDQRDKVLSGYQVDGRLEWQSREIVLSNGIGPKLEFDFMYYLQYLHGEDNQQMIVTIDHLFLLENGKVKPVQYLTPNDRLRRPDGQLAEVLFVVCARYVGGLHHVSFEGFNNTTLNGHLLSANGVVTSDYSVQLAYSAGQLNPELLDEAKDEPLQVGTAEYAARYENPALREFLADSNRWPTGLNPLPRPLINVPAGARAFFTENQAQELRSAVPAYPPTSTINMATTRWLMNTIYSSYRPKTTFLLDWQNPLPNVYGWQSDGTGYVLITGGMALLEGLQYEGLAWLLAHGIAASTSLDCVGPADYATVFTVLKLNWSNSLFFEIYSAGLEQVGALFAAIKDNEADPNNLCGQPSLRCRLETYAAAAASLPLPECAIPTSAFALNEAKVGRTLTSVDAIFSMSLDIASATTRSHYKIKPADPERPEPVVSKVMVVAKSNRTARLTVTGLESAQAYELFVDNVISETGVSLNPNKSSVGFTTP